MGQTIFVPTCGTYHNIWSDYNTNEILISYKHTNNKAIMFKLQKHKNPKAILNDTMTSLLVYSFLMFVKFAILFLIIYSKHYLEFDWWNESGELMCNTLFELLKP